MQAEAGPGAWTVVGLRLAVAFLFHSIFVFGYLPAPCSVSRVASPH